MDTAFRTPALRARAPTVVNELTCNEYAPTTRASERRVVADPVLVGVHVIPVQLSYSHDCPARILVLVVSMTLVRTILVVDA